MLRFEQIILVCVLLEDFELNSVWMFYFAYTVKINDTLHCIAICFAVIFAQGCQFLNLNCIILNSLLSTIWASCKFDILMEWLQYGKSMQWPLSM